MDFTTEGLTLEERYDILNKVKPIPIGITCYKAGGFIGDTTTVEVDSSNQEMVTMFWNSLYFLNKEDADYATDMEHAKYEAWLYAPWSH